MTPDAKKHIELGIGVICFAGIVALGIYIWTQATKLANACFYITGGSVNNLSASNVDITLFISIKNISDLTIVINSLNLAVSLNGVFVTTVSQNVNQTITSQSTTVVSVDLNFAPDDLLKAGTDTVSDILSNTAAVVIGTSGTVSVTAGGVTASNVSISDEITLQQIQQSSKAPSTC